jgi:hypothetical protein
MPSIDAQFGAYRQVLAVTNKAPLISLYKATHLFTIEATQFSVAVYCSSSFLIPLAFPQNNVDHFLS